jgi:hypothetical protein
MTNNAATLIEQCSACATACCHSVCVLATASLIKVFVPVFNLKASGGELSGCTAANQRGIVRVGESVKKNSYRSKGDI